MILFSIIKRSCFFLLYGKKKHGETRQWKLVKVLCLLVLRGGISRA